MFIDLLGYSDLQLLKAKRSQAVPQSSVDPTKTKKRYLILTYLEKYNQDKSMNLDASGSIKEEIEVDTDKTHYPLPLNMLEIKDIASLRAQDVSKATLRMIIRQMGEIVS